MRWLKWRIEVGQNQICMWIDDAKWSQDIAEWIEDNGGDRFILGGIGE